MPKPWAVPGAWRLGESAPRARSHALWGADSTRTRSLLGSAGYHARARPLVAFQRPTDSACGHCGPTLPSQTPPQGAGLLVTSRREAAAMRARAENLTIGWSKGLGSRA